MAHKFIFFVDSLNQSIAKIIAWFTLVMVFLTLLIVVLRYGFSLGWIALQESVMYLHACAFMLGAAYTFQVNEHVRVDIFYRNFSKRKQAWVEVFGGLFLLLPVNLFIGIASWNYVANSWQLFESSGEAGGLPFVYLLKSLIILLVILLVLQGLAEVIRNSIRLIKNDFEDQL